MKTMQSRIRVQLLTVAASIAALVPFAAAQNGGRQFQQDQQQQQDNGNNNQGGYNNQQGGYNNFQRGNRQYGGGGQGFGGQGFGGRQGRNRLYQQYAVGSGQGGTDDYSVIAQKSIFLRDRYVRPVGDGVAAPIPPEQATVVTAIVFDIEAGVWRAYIENVSTHETRSLKVGDKVADGEIVDVNINSLGYRRTGATETVRAEIGHNLTGAEVLSMTALSARASLGGVQFRQQQPMTGVAPPPLDPNTAGLSMEERLKLRRAQESLGGAAPAPAPQPQVVAPPTEPQPPTLALPDNPNTAGLSVEERLRLRRQQEQGR